MGQSASFQGSDSHSTLVEEEAIAASGHGGYEKLQIEMKDTLDDMDSTSLELGEHETPDSALQAQPSHSPTGQIGGIAMSDNAHISGGIVAGGDVHLNVALTLTPSASETWQERQRLREEAEAKSRLLNEVVDWLAPHSYFRDVQSENFEKWTAGTLSWFLTADLYKSWKQGGNRIIWGTGIPGAGKTVLASRAVHDLEEYKNTVKGKICVLFAYCRYSERLPVNEILEALVKQFLECDPSLVSIVEPIYSHHKLRKTRPSQAELLALLQQLEQHFEVVYYVIDGLDEALVDTQFDLIQAVNALRGRFALTSRPLKRLESGLPATKFYPVTPNATDIKLLVIQKINRNPHFRALLEKYGCRDQLIRRILNKSSGMILHAALQIEIIHLCESITCVQRNLDRFPAKLRGMYHQAMVRICEQSPPDNVDLAKHVLLWLVFGNEAVSLPALQQLVVTTCDDAVPAEGAPLPDGAAVLSVCCGLARIEVKTNLVLLVHFTAKEALAPILMRDFPNPHAALFRAAAQHLLAYNIPNNRTMETDVDLYILLRRHPALRYSYEHWAYHAKHCASDPAHSSEVLQFLKQCTSYPVSDGFSLEPYSPLHVTAAFGLDDLIEEVLLDIAKGDITIRTEGSEWQKTPLMLAAQNGHTKTVDKLLKLTRRTMLKNVIGGHGKPGMHLFTGQINLRDSAGRTALMHACGHPETARRLLEHPDVQVNVQSKVGWTALMLATEEETFTSLLRHKDIQVNLKDIDGETALMYVVRGGTESAAERLLAHPDVQVNLKGKEGSTALMHAADSGRGGMVRLLLRHKDILPNIRDKQGRTALMCAVAKGRVGAVKAFLEFDTVDVNATTPHFLESSLMLATTPRMVSLLLESCRVDVTLRDKDGDTALTRAQKSVVVCRDEEKRKNWEEIVALLTNHEGDPGH
ncbi:ankyrin repeat domain-containing protein 50 [Coprinopsis cinerea AmutBmut pab1-1]|nr:ankyrin repeat domain-containing protein 50 [Coprinopsis cinerea AmutBmut pab1-1]